MTKTGILSKVAAGEMTADEAAAALEPKMEIKVSQRGAVQINGLRRFPITLYPTEIKRIFEKQAEILAFIDNHRKELSFKGE